MRDRHRVVARMLGSLALLWGVLLGAPAAAQQQTFTLTASADTHVTQENVNATCGACTFLVTFPGSGVEYRALYKFDLSGLPAGSKVISATLRLYVLDPDNGAVDVHRITADWVESTVTWQNSAGMAHDAVKTASFTPSTRNAYATADVSSLVGQWMGGTANYGLLLKGRGYAEYTSREHATSTQRPQLAVTVQLMPVFAATSATTVLSDPLNAAANPKRVPGSVVRLDLTLANSGAGATDTGATSVDHPVPAQHKLYVGDLGAAGSGPVQFVQGSPSSGLTYTFSGLASTTDSLSFSADGGTSFTYTPIPDASGYDAAVTTVRIKPAGAFAGAAGAGSPSFTARMRLSIR